MERRTLAFLLALLLILSACGGTGGEKTAGEKTAAAEPTWQEQYDLGVRYLSEGNYEEAIIAFSAAIEIDPKRAEAYVGRGDAYVLSGETEENLAAAQADYEQAVALDERNEDAYMGIADVYIRQGKYEEAYELLKTAVERVGPGAEKISAKIAEIESGIYADSQDHVRRKNSYGMDDKLTGYTIYHYDFLGRRASWENYNLEYNNGDETGEMRLTDSCEVTFNDFGEPAEYQFYDPDGNPTSRQPYQYNEKHQKIRADRYNQDGELVCYYLWYYDEKGRQTKYEVYENDVMTAYWVQEYDESGKMTGERRYDPDGTQTGYTVYE